MEFNHKIVSELMWTTARVAARIKEGNQQEIDMWFYALTTTWQMDYEFLDEYISAFDSIRRILKFNFEGVEAERWEVFIGRLQAYKKEMDSALPTN